MAHVKISVIIPVYNVEKYLKECVESVITQSYKQIEIILVDDGSIDQCPLMCDEFARIESRVQVIHKTNGGLSDARNAGIDIATGDYLFFLDSDDTIHKLTLEKLLELATITESDITATTLFTGENSGITYYGNNIPMLIELTTHVGTWSAWGKLFKKEIFDGIRFPKGLLYEDFYIISELVLRAHKIALVDNGMYFYTIRNDSITGSTSDCISIDLILGCRHNLEIIKDINKSAYLKLFSVFILQPIKVINFHNGKINVSRQYLKLLYKFLSDYKIELKRNPYLKQKDKNKILFLKTLWLINLFKGRN